MPDDDEHPFTRWLKEMLARADMSAYALSQQSLPSEPYVSRLVKGGQTHPSAEYVVSMAETLAARITPDMAERRAIVNAGLLAAGHAPLESETPRTTTTVEIRALLEEVKKIKSRLDSALDSPSTLGLLRFLLDQGQLVDLAHLPVKGSTPAGPPEVRVEEVLTLEDLIGETFGLVIEGESMLPEVRPGDIILVRPVEGIPISDLIGKTVVVLIDGESTYKKLQGVRQEGDRLLYTFSSSNGAYHAFDAPAETTLIQGVVVRKITGFNR